MAVEKILIKKLVLTKLTYSLNFYVTNDIARFFFFLESILIEHTDKLCVFKYAIAEHSIPLEEIRGDVARMSQSTVVRVIVIDLLVFH